jgi:predicted TIM-barrel fold metal-dependent hydrolase
METMLRNGEQTIGFRNKKMRNSIAQEFIWLTAYVLLLVCHKNGMAGTIQKPDTLYPRIDAHIHLYDTRRQGSALFLDSVRQAKIYSPHLAKEFAAVGVPAGVGFAVVIEASQRREDNFWLMDLVDSSDQLIAFIANLDPRDPWYIKDLDSLTKSPKFRGIRIRPLRPLTLSDPQIIDKFGELEKRGLVLELGGSDLDPEVLKTIARRYPHMNIILDHLAGGRFYSDRSQLDKWKERLVAFASEPNVYCKVSALFDLSGEHPAPLNPSFYDTMIDPVVDLFGPDRVLFGSNWTLSDLFGPYSEMIRIVDDYCKRRGDLSPDQLFYKNIKRAYRFN